MYTIIIIALLVAIFLGYREYKYGFYPDMESIAMMSFLGIIVGVGVGLGFAFYLDAELITIEKETQIEVLNDNNSTSGSFFLGTGNIDGKMKYVFYTKENNRFRLKQVDYNDAYIEYTENNPTVIKYSKQSTDSFKNLFAIDYWEPYYLFKIPKGSISNGYNLDAK